MNRLICKLSAFLFLGMFFTACQPSSAPKIISSGNRPPQTGRPMPPLSSDGKTVNLQDLGWQLQSGARQKLSDHKGKVIVLDFWATYCDPCLREIPDLVELQNKHKDEGLAVIGLNVGGDEDRPYIPNFVKKLNIQYDLGYPDEELVSFLFRGVTDIPQTFVFGRDGSLVKSFLGYSPQIKADMDEAVRQALAN